MLKYFHLNFTFEYIDKYKVQSPTPQVVGGAKGEEVTAEAFERQILATPGRNSRAKQQQPKNQDW